MKEADGVTARTIALSGRNGFIGRKVALRLEREEGIETLALTHDHFRDTSALAGVLEPVDTVIHLAAKNRAPDDELYKTNVRLVKTLLEATRDLPKLPHIIFSSSTQRSNDSAYGRSKRDGEELLRRWSSETGGAVTILVIPNVFGPGCKPFYNSVVATFAHLFAQRKEPEIHVDRELELVYVSDVAEAVLAAVTAKPNAVETITVGPIYRRTVSQLFDDFARFARSHFEDHTVPALETPLDTLLCTTFQAYLGYPGYRHAPPIHEDARGFLMECVRQEIGGQVFFSTTRPGVVRGNHYHTRKLEKFCVLKGEAVIRLRELGSSKVVEYRVSGERPEVLDIPVFHVHNIENVGDGDLYTLFWANEIFDPERPDTYYEQV